MISLQVRGEQSLRTFGAFSFLTKGTPWVDEFTCVNASSAPTTSLATRQALTRTYQSYIRQADELLTRQTDSPDGPIAQ